MDFGFGIPTRGPLASPENLTALATKGEEMGFGIISVSDHIIMPKDINSIYPYNESGEFAGRGAGDCMEQLTMLGFLAGVTSSARLLTSVMVLPHRNPVHTAKTLATIDVLSNGRLDVGCGVGWMKEEFEAIGTPPFEERGAIGDEYIRAFRELWESDDPSFDGKYCSFSKVTFLPKPVQKTSIPIWIGGESPPALRRAGSLGDVWFPIGTNPRFTVGTPQQYAEYASRVRGHAEAVDRDPASLDFAYSAGWYNDRQAETLPNGERRTLTGTPEQIAGDIHAFEEVGVGHMMLGLQADTMYETLERMERFATNVRPLV